MKFLGVAVLALTVAFLCVPVVQPAGPESSVLIDRDGELLAARVAADEQWRFGAPRALPAPYIAAVVAYEDRRFWWHPGVDPIALIRASVSNLAAGRVVSGASTVTMQVVRLARHQRQRTFAEKAVEAVLAVRLELARSKSEILVLYAASAPFGGNTVGLEAATFRLFGHTPESLSWAEAATLAVLPKNPALVHPGRNRATLRARRDELLHTLHQRGELSEADLVAALAEALPEVARRVPLDAPHLLDASREGRTTTTLDGDLQRRAAQIVENHISGLRGNGIHNAAAIMVDLPTGEVLAYIGNVRPDPQAAHGEHVDINRSPRSTGSLLKPFLYASMLESGELLPSELVPDVPTRFAGFSPENFDHSYEGAVPASSALARSRNVPAVWMLRDHTVDRFFGRLKTLGLTTLFRPASDYGLALIVGGAEGTLWDLVSAYRDLALSAAPGETRIPPAMHWRRPEQALPLRDRPLKAGAAWLTLQALVEVNRPGADAAWRDFEGSERVAWKTGTSFGFRDALAIGVTPQTAIGVWVGNADGEGRPGLTGTQAAAPLLFDLFGLRRGGAFFGRPDEELAEVRVCALSGQIAGANCESARMESVERTGAQGKLCRYCQRIHTNAEGTERFHAGCAPLTELHAQTRFVLPPGMEHWYAKRHASYEPLPPWGAGCSPGADDNPLAVTSPANDTIIYVPTEVDGTRGRVVVSATHRDPLAAVFWHLDGNFLSVSTAPHQLSLDPEPGLHWVTVVDAAGHRNTLQFSIRR